MAVLVATHDAEFAAAFARRTVLLGDGRLVADAPTDEVLGGGWYFATQVARVLPGSLDAEAAAARLRGDDDVASATPTPARDSSAAPTDDLVGRGLG
jgi:energy-coupling factor transport system ATP-binding protein